MTVAELIEELASLAPDTPVTVAGLEPEVVWTMEGGRVVGADVREAES